MSWKIPECKWNSIIEAVKIIALQISNTCFTESACANSSVRCISCPRVSQFGGTNTEGLSSDCSTQQFPLSTQVIFQSGYRWFRNVKAVVMALICILNRSEEYYSIIYGQLELILDSCSRSSSWLFNLQRVSVANWGIGMPWGTLKVYNVSPWTSFILFLGRGKVTINLNLIHLNHNI